MPRSTSLPHSALLAKPPSSNRVGGAQPKDVQPGAPDDHRRRKTKSEAWIRRVAGSSTWSEKSKA